MHTTIQNVRNRAVEMPTASREARSPQRRPQRRPRSRCRRCSRHAAGPVETPVAKMRRTRRGARSPCKQTQSRQQQQAPGATERVKGCSRTGGSPWVVAVGIRVLGSARRKGKGYGFRVSKQETARSPYAVERTESRPNP